MRMAMTVAMMPLLEVRIVVSEIVMAVFDLDFISTAPERKGRSKAGARHQCQDGGR